MFHKLHKKKKHSRKEVVRSGSEVAYDETQKTTDALEELKMKSGETLSIESIEFDPVDEQKELEDFLNADDDEPKNRVSKKHAK